MVAVMLYMTATDQDEAKRIARALLEEKLIACATIWQGAASLYVWEGKFYDAPEASVIAKTTAALAQQAVSRARALHSYECPCIVTLPITGGHPAFLDWVETQCAPASD